MKRFVQIINLLVSKSIVMFFMDQTYLNFQYHQSHHVVNCNDFRVYVPSWFLQIFLILFNFIIKTVSNGLILKNTIDGETYLNEYPKFVFFNNILSFGIFFQLFTKESISLIQNDILYYYFF